MSRYILFSLPFVIFFGIAILLWRGLSLEPNKIPSPLINKPIPEFRLPLLENPDKKLTHHDLYGHITLVNIWATWCVNCVEEHDLLIQIAKNTNLKLIGLNYKDNPSDAKKWLTRHGNPYDTVLSDPTGQAAIDWGVYGTPESFLIDKKGIVRYKQIGPMTEQVWFDTIKPLIEQLEDERI